MLQTAGLWVTEGRLLWQNRRLHSDAAAALQMLALPETEISYCAAAPPSSATQGPVRGNVGVKMDDKPIQANFWDYTLRNMLSSTSLVLCVSGRVSPLPSPPVKPSQLSVTASKHWMEMVNKERGTAAIKRRHMMIGC